MTDDEQIDAMMEAAEMEEREMNYSEAIELLGLTTPKSMSENAKLAQSMYNGFARRTPLRYKVAAMIVIRAAE